MSHSADIKEWLQHQIFELASETVADDNSDNRNNYKNKKSAAEVERAVEIYEDGNGNCKRRRQAVIDSSIDYCCDNRTENVNKAINKFLVSNAIPFNVVKSESFSGMVGSLNKAYEPKLPHPDTFRRKYLPELYCETQRNIKEMWNDMGNPYRTVGYDGHTGEIINNVLMLTETVEDKTAFDTCFDAKENRKSSDWVCERISNRMERKQKN